VADSPAVEAGVARQRARVPLPVPDAFALFTDGINEWWPLDEGFTYGGDRYDGIVLEARVGGRFYERFRDGEEFDVGRVVVCEPPERIVFTWRDPGWRDETEVEVTFEADAEETVVALAHRGFERLGAGWEEIWGRWNSGWPRVMAALERSRSS
jgi:uncharacterized protein YndB with AHSA1/START domain